MSVQLSSQVVWQELQNELFAVLGMVTASGEARTIGVVYIVRDQKLYIVTGKETWKARHCQQNPDVSITVPISKRIPIMPWVKIPPATISFSGKASVLDAKDSDPDIVRAITPGLEADSEKLTSLCVIEINPVGEFITYGVGVSLLTMRDNEKARARSSIMNDGK